jgi:hypothetical protein
MEANQQPPEGGDISNATPGLVGVSFLFAITLIAYGVRIYTRIRPTFKLATPDYIITAALVGTKSNHLMWTMLMFITAVRIDHIYQFASGHRLWPGTLQLLYFTDRSGQDPEVFLPTRINRVLGIFPRENIDREYASSLPNI